MKNTDRLEEFVKANRDAFDNLEPSPQLWQNISEKQKKTKVIYFRNYIFRAAAVIVIVVISSAIFVNYTFFRNQDNAISQNPELKELFETEAFYAHQVNGKLQEIRKCYSTIPELQDVIESDLTELETMYKLLQNDLKDNIANKTVIEAMIENNRFRLKLVDSVLDQINC